MLSIKQRKQARTLCLNNTVIMEILRQLIYLAHQYWSLILSAQNLLSYIEHFEHFQVYIKHM